jgi:dihydrofolate reductase
LSFHVIVAVDRRGGMARDGGMPWHLPADLKWFKRQTAGDGAGVNRVLMGRRTWESLPERYRPLPGRVNLVMTRQADYQAEGAELVSSLDQAVAATPDGAELWVVGGAEIYALALADPRCERILITEIDADFDCDVHFPSREGLQLLSAEPAAVEAGLSYCFCEYRRR